MPPPKPNQAAVASNRSSTSSSSNTTTTSIIDQICRPIPLITLSLLLRLLMLLYGLYQDSTSPVKYTDIDYLVFTDASRYLSQNQSPYLRSTYRYTPLLAYLLLPTAFAPQSIWFSFGKVVFSVADVLAGVGMLKVLKMRGVEERFAGRIVAAVWLLNPFVAGISTRGSSEGVLAGMVVFVVWAVERRFVGLAGVGVAVAAHWKVYPVVYGVSILWWLGGEEAKRGMGLSAVDEEKEKTISQHILGFFTKPRLIFTSSSILTFTGLNLWMYTIYGTDFLTNTFTYHLSRLDHRHNFSPYHTLLYLLSSPVGSLSSPYSTADPTTALSSPASNHLLTSLLPFLPQFLLTTLLLPLAFSKLSLPSTLFAQTFSFVAFNKVCTSQYFIWYLVLLPFYLPESSFVTAGKKGITAIILWVAAQAIWLSFGYLLEFEGKQVFFPGLWAAGLLFFGVNCWILGVVVEDLGWLRGRGRGRGRMGGGEKMGKE